MPFFAFMTLVLRWVKCATLSCVTVIFDTGMSYHRMVMPLMFSSLYILIFMTKTVRGTENGAQLIHSPDNLEMVLHGPRQKAQLGTLTTACAQLLVLQSLKDFPSSLECLCVWVRVYVDVAKVRHLNMLFLVYKILFGIVHMS